jgi:hypothetical protein
MPQYRYYCKWCGTEVTTLTCPTCDKKKEAERKEKEKQKEEERKQKEKGKEEERKKKQKEKEEEEKRKKEEAKAAGKAY